MWSQSASWASCAVQQLPISYLFYTWQCICVSATVSIPKGVPLSTPSLCRLLSCRWCSHYPWCCEKQLFLPSDSRQSPRFTAYRPADKKGHMPPPSCECSSPLPGSKAHGRGQVRSFEHPCGFEINTLGEVRLEQGLAERFEKVLVLAP